LGYRVKASDADLLGNLDRVIDLDAEALRTCSNSFR
jgi:hypothetical protein